jgi:hypothetical protein
MHRPLVPRIHAKSTETQGNAAKIVFVDLNGWQHSGRGCRHKENAAASSPQDQEGQGKVSENETDRRLHRHPAINYAMLATLT